MYHISFVEQCKVFEQIPDEPWSTRSLANQMRSDFKIHKMRLSVSNRRNFEFISFRKRSLLEELLI